MPKTNSADKPWERQKGESEKAYEAFITYRDLGAKRGVSAVSEELTKSRQLISRWKSTWNWDERCREWDNQLQREAKQKAVDELGKMTKRQIKIAMQLQNAALEALAKTKPEDMAPKDILAFIKSATAIERDNRRAELEAASAEVQKTSAEGPSTLADAFNEAWRRRKEQNEP